MLKQFGFKFFVNKSRVTGKEFAKHHLRRKLSLAEVEACMELIRYRLFCIYTGKVTLQFDNERQLFYTEIDDYNLRVLYSIDDEVCSLHDVEF